MELIKQWVDAFNNSASVLQIFVLLAVGLFLTVYFGFIQFRKLPHALRVVRGKYDDPSDPGDISHFKALTTALSATVGVGNIAGVALAVQIGGPGAVFWMWVTAALGMATKFAECSLGHKYRKTLPDQSVSGGPMYYIEEAFGTLSPKIGKFMGVFFATAFVFLAMNIGNLIQANTAAETLSASYGVNPLFVGIGLALLLFVVIIGGVKRIGDVTSKLVPTMASLYVGFALLIILMNIGAIVPCFKLIFSDAFNGTAATGGFIGSSFLIAARMGIARGLFSNEAGMGSAPIAHSAAKTKESISQGVVAILEPFIDTICICTITALVILMTGVWETSELQGAALTVHGFTSGLPTGLISLGTHVINLGILLFAFSTIISWSYYGEQALVYLSGAKYIKIYRLFQCVVTVVGSVFALELVWALGDFFIFFTTIPNLIAIMLLIGVLKKETKTYFEKFS